LIQGLLNEPDSKKIVKPEFLDATCKIIASHCPVYNWSDYYTRSTFEQIRKTLPDKDILISAENLFGMMSHADNCYTTSAEVIEYLFQDYDIHLFMYVRRQDTYLESLYNQDVKRYETRTFDQYLEEARLENLHWDVIADTYSRFDLTVRPFERKVLNTGGYSDFIDALYRWLGERVVAENIPHINPSLSLAGMDIQMVANHVLSQKQAYDLSCWLERHCPKPPDEKHDLLKNRREIIEYYRESNKRLFENHMSDFDASYYG